MKVLRYIAVSSLLAILPLSVSAWDIKDLLGKAGESLSNGQSAVTDIIDGVLSKSELEVKELAGTWTVTGSAVSFQSENFLQQAGGTAASSVVEKKLNPYYKKYGLTGGTLTIDKDGEFTLKIKKITLSGTVEKQKSSGKNSKEQAKGNFIFNFNSGGLMNLGAVNTFVSKSPGGMDVMFDASKLQQIISGVASVSNMQLAQSVSAMLNSYDGICIGFKLTQSGKGVTAKSKK